MTDVERIEIRGKNYYIPSVGLLPRVSSRLELFVPKPGLVGWAMNLVADNVRRTLTEWSAWPDTGLHISPEQLEALITEAKRQPGKQRDAAADLGTRAHAAIVNHIKGGKEPCPADCEWAVRNFDNWLAETRATMGNLEYTIWCPEHCYAGTVDFFYQDRQGNLCIGDIKTGKAIYPEMFLQMAAYAHAASEQIGRTIESVTLLRVAKDKEEFEVRQRSRAEWLEDFEVFAHGLAVAAWMEAQKEA